MKNVKSLGRAYKGTTSLLTSFKQTRHKRVALLASLFLCMAQTWTLSAMLPLKTVTPSPANPGDTLTFTIDITNTSTTLDATSVSFEDKIDKTTFVSVTQSPSRFSSIGYDAGSKSVMATGANFAPGDTCTITITVKVPCTLVAGTYLNDAVLDFFLQGNLMTIPFEAPYTINSGAINFSSGFPQVTDVLCNGQSTGSIEVEVTGGGPTYTYVLQSVSTGPITVGPTTNMVTFSNLPADTYTLTVNGCQLSDNIKVTQPSPFSITTTTSTPACNAQSTGTINVTYTGGLAPISYSLDGGAFVAAPAGNPFTITGLVGSGSPYTIQLSDSTVPTPCTSNTANQLVGINNLAITATSATPACNALATGTINVTYTGGIGTIFYSLNGGAFVAAPAGNPFTITGLVGSGSPYTIQLMDSALPTPCTSNTANQLVGINNLAITATSATPACNALATGTMNVTYTGGIGTILYSLNGGAFVAAPAGNPFTITGLVGSGSPYTIQLMDSALPTPCTSNTAHQLVGINNLAITATSATPACNALATGTINVTYTGGIGTVFYSLNGGAFVAAPAGNPFTITGLVGSGSPYTIQLMDSAMPTPCTSSPASQLVGINDLAITGTLSTPSCIGESTGTINVTYTGGIGTIFYSLNGGAFVAAPPGNPFTITGLAGGGAPYSIQLMDSAMPTPCTSSPASQSVGLISCNTTLAIYDCCSSKISSSDVATYTISIKNTGMVAATDLQVIDLLPCCLTFLSGSGEGWSFTSAGRQVTATLSNTTPLLPGAITTLTIKAKAHCASDQKITNTVTVSASNVVVPLTSSCTTKVD